MAALKISQEHQKVHYFVENVSIWDNSVVFSKTTITHTNEYFQKIAVETLFIGIQDGLDCLEPNDRVIDELRQLPDFGQQLLHHLILAADAQLFDANGM